MDSITFRNIRKFKEETTFELNNINILVGPNNSGKSTLTKGLRLYLFNILNLKVNSDNMFVMRPFFQFGGSVFDNPHIGTFGRALSKNTDDDNIYFSARFFNTVIETTVSRFSIHSKDTEGNLIDYLNRTSAPISQIRIYNLDLDAGYWFDFEKQTYSIGFNVIGKGNYYKMWEKRLVDEGKNVTNGKYDPNDSIAILIPRLKRCLTFGSRERIIMETKLLPQSLGGNLYENLLTHIAAKSHVTPWFSGGGFFGGGFGCTTDLTFPIGSALTSSRL